eukprot:767067-Hanusia_phi.AAC.3
MRPVTRTLLLVRGGGDSRRSVCYQAYSSSSPSFSQASSRFPWVLPGWKREESKSEPLLALHSTSLKSSGSSHPTTDLLSPPPPPPPPPPPSYPTPFPSDPTPFPSDPTPSPLILLIILVLLSILLSLSSSLRSSSSSWSLPCLPHQPSMHRRRLVLDFLDILWPLPQGLAEALAGGSGRPPAAAPDFHPSMTIAQVPDGDGEGWKDEDEDEDEGMEELRTRQERR